MASDLRKCEICREWVEPERLQDLPNTQLCVKHAKEIKKYGSEFKTEATLKSTGKTGSMKQNQNDVTTRQVPNREAIEKLRRDYEEEQYGG